MPGAVSEQQPFEKPALFVRLRERFGARAIAITLALLVELLLALLFLTLAPQILMPQESVPMSIFGVSPEEEEAAEAQAPAKASTQAPPTAQRAEPQPADPTPRPPQPQAAEIPPPLLNIPLGQMPDIGALPRGPVAPTAPRGVAGPPNPGPVPGDSKRVEGRGPRGEPLYAASWYREPYDSELSGYLSTASGPGWARIICRTIRDFRVDNCQKVAESPEGSQIARAVLAAAWQFRVRPPRVGGEPQVGEWVQIHIDYGIRPR